MSDEPTTYRGHACTHGHVDDDGMTTRSIATGLCLACDAARVRRQRAKREAAKREAREREVKREVKREVMP